MTAFANSHLTVLKQSTAAIISTVRIYGNLLSQIIRMLFLFLYIENFNFRYHSAFLWINYFSYSQILIELFFLSGGIIFVAPSQPGGGSRPSAAAPRGLPGCGEAELSQENRPIKSFELIKHASDIQEASKAFETATVLVAVVEHLFERQRVMRSNR